ncbi:hypothetical protein MTR_3g117085 [Medicago truncatula]|uniref:Uncharacterized protein n=1 Tax=Medicago truncatula TaxID=3880 RepID=A0A072V3J0_MEDTR|nr:hypothetical protein MTR_3g117085 [Medicago truncatula]
MTQDGKNLDQRKQYFEKPSPLKDSPQSPLQNPQRKSCIEIPSPATTVPENASSTVRKLMLELRCNYRYF